MKQKVLLVVPHQDDELFVGGGLFKQLMTDGAYEGYVVFTTNGDFFAHEARVRLRESLYVLTRLYGLEESHIFFLGYGDGWQGGAHIYHQKGEEALLSVAGKTETYGISGHEDYRFLKTGAHSACRRADFKRDLKDVLREVRADIVLAVDFDKHPDHRAASLLTEECLGELFRENMSYRPLVLKRFAYDGVWKGRADFFEFPQRATVLAEVQSSPYHEEEALRFAMPADCCTPCLSRNFLYQAFRCYKTQEIWQKADEIINIDEVFFQRNTDNLLYGAELIATSGNPAYLRDFKLFDCGDVMQKELVLGECGWKPEAADAEKRVRIHFASPQTVGKIAVYARGNQETDRLVVAFSFDNGMEILEADIRPDGKRNLFNISPRSGVRDMELRIVSWEGISGGITELEILPPEDTALPEILVEQIFREGERDAAELTDLVKIRIKVEKAKLSLKRKISRYLPNDYVLRRHYTELADAERTPVRYRIRYIRECLKNRRRKKTGAF